MSEPFADEESSGPAGHPGTVCGSCGHVVREPIPPSEVNAFHDRIAVETGGWDFQDAYCMNEDGTECDECGAVNWQDYD